MSDGVKTCVAEKWGDYSRYTCGKPAKYEEGGKWYCGWCLPSKVVARRAGKHAKRRERMVAVRAHADKVKAARDAVVVAAEAHVLADGDVDSMLTYESLRSAVAGLRVLEGRA